MLVEQEVITLRWLDVIRLAVLVLLLSGNSLAQTPPDKRPDDPFLITHRELVDKNPEKLSVALQLKNNQTRFHPGEIIPLELRFSSSLSDTYLMSTASYDRSGRLDIDRFVIDGTDTAIDPLRDYYHSGQVFMGGGLSGIDTLGPKPQLINYELNEWWRCDRPGKYRLYIVSHRITKGKLYHSGNTLVNPVSNIVEFEIQPRDEKWERQTLADAARLLDSSPPPKGYGDDPRHPGCRVLRFLDTEASIKDVIRRFRGEDRTCDFEYDFGLLGTAHREFAVTQLETAMYDRDQPITGSFLNTLIFLASVRDSGPVPDYPLSDPLAQKIWQTQAEARRNAADSIRTKYISQLTVAVKEKQGAASATSLITLAESGRSNSETDQATRNEIAAALAKIFFDLPLEKQRSLIDYQWNMISSPLLLPVLRRLYEHPPDLRETPAPFPGLALLRIYELAPEEGRQLILDEIRRPDLRVRSSVLGLLPDETLPQLEDTIVATAITRPDANSLGLIARYVSAGSLPRLRVAFENQIGRLPCAEQTSLLSYFLRADQNFGLTMIKKALDSRQHTRCYPDVLKAVAGDQFSPELEALALPYLNDQNPEVVLSAVRMLSARGSKDNKLKIKAAIKQLLDRWREAKVDPDAPADGSIPFAGYLAEELLRTYALAVPWVTTPDEFKELADLCLNEQCRQQLKPRDLLAKTDIHFVYFAGAREERRFSLGDYLILSWPAVKKKVLQYPAGTKFTWHADNQVKELDQQLFAELKSYLQEKGFELVRYEPPKSEP